MAVTARHLTFFARLPWLAAILLAAACSSPGTSADHARTPAAKAEPSAITDASYDWHVLVIVPFGVLLKDSAVPLHEVLLFHEATDRAETDGRECYSTPRTPPRFLGQQPDHYLLCFDHDRLGRIEAAVPLPAADAPQVFARACALWLKNTAAIMTSGTTCEGRDGSVMFSARLVRLPGDTAATVSMSLTDNPPQDAPVGN